MTFPVDFLNHSVRFNYYGVYHCGYLRRISRNLDSVKLMDLEFESVTRVGTEGVAENLLVVPVSRDCEAFIGVENLMVTFDEVPKYFEPLFYFKFDGAVG